MHRIECGYCGRVFDEADAPAQRAAIALHFARACRRSMSLSRVEIT